MRGKSLLTNRGIFAYMLWRPVWVRRNGGALRRALHQYRAQQVVFGAAGADRAVDPGRDQLVRGQEHGLGPGGDRRWPDRVRLHTRPVRTPQAAAAAREDRPSLRRMLARCRWTVCSLSTSRWAMSGLLNPCATSLSTSSSRGVRTVTASPGPPPRGSLRSTLAPSAARPARSPCRASSATSAKSRV